jgi:hypothetical protein
MADNSEIDELVALVARSQRAEDAVMALIDMRKWTQIRGFFRHFAGCGPTTGIL